MMANSILLEQISNRQTPLTIKGKIVMPMRITSDPRQIILQELVEPISARDVMKLLPVAILDDKLLVKQIMMYLQQKRITSKPDPILEEVINESEESLTRVWSTGYDDDWD